MNEGRHIDDGRERERELLAGLGAWARSSRALGERLGAPATRDVDGARELGSVVADRYVLKAYLGRGRYGEIYRAVDLALSDPQIGQEHSVALHLFPHRLSQQTTLLQKLESSHQHPYLWAHPNVVKVCGFGCDLGQYFLATELLDGVSLRAVLDEPRSEQPSEAETLAVLRGVGDALKYAHAKGTIHGDIQLEKIFITNEYAVKVLDLLPASPPRTVPFYVEDAEPNGLVAPDPRDDVYGLACLAYQLFAGRHPFNANSPLQALNAGLEVPPLRQLSEQQRNAIARGLALRREQRTPSVAAFLAELGITGQETLRPPGETAPDAAAPASAVPPASAPSAHARARDDDVPIIGDYSDALGAPTRHEPPPSPTRRAASRTSNRPPPLDPADLYYGLAEPERRREPGRFGLRFASFLLFVVVAAAATYWSSDALRTRSAEWLAMGRTVAENALSRDAGDIVRLGPESVVAPPIAGTPPDPRSDVANEPPAVAGEETSASPAAAQPSSESGSPPRTEEHADAARRQAPAAVAVEPIEPVEPESFEFASRAVSVSEGEARAAVQIVRRGGDLGRSSVVWWTSDGSARAGDDYVGFGATIEKFAAGETVRTIHIPIVGDSKREGRESFYVNLRGRERPVGHRESAQRLEIVIVDND